MLSWERVNELRRCMLCGSDNITVENIGDRVRTSDCGVCGAVVCVEFDPVDDPSLRGRIEVLVEPRTKPDGARKSPTGPRSID